MKLDDSIFEFALYDVLDALAVEAGRSVSIDALRDAWRGTALRHSDLPNAISLLVEAGSLVVGGENFWRLTEAGRARAARLASESATTMEDQVSRSVIKTLRERVPPAGLAPRSGHRRRMRDSRGRNVYGFGRTS